MRWPKKLLICTSSGFRGPCTLSSLTSFYMYFWTTFLWYYPPTCMVEASPSLCHWGGRPRTVCLDVLAAIPIPLVRLQFDSCCYLSLHSTYSVFSPVAAIAITSPIYLYISDIHEVMWSSINLYQQIHYSFANNLRSLVRVEGYEKN